MEEDKVFEKSIETLHEELKELKSNVSKHRKKGIDVSLVHLQTLRIPAKIQFANKLDSDATDLG